MTKTRAPEADRQLSDPALDALWRHVLDRWDDAAAHTAFLQQASISGRLADAALRYRGMAGDRARKDAAEKHLAAITALAFAQIEASRSPPPRTNRVLFVVALTISLLLGVVSLLALRG